MIPWPLIFLILISVVTAQRGMDEAVVHPKSLKVPARPPPPPNSKLSRPNKPKPSKPRPKPKMITKDNNTTAEVVQANMAALDDKISGSAALEQGIELGLAIVQAIIATDSLRAPKRPPTATPTFKAQDFNPCRAYASRLQACASQTPSFYSLQPNEQASCVCYATPTGENCPAATKVTEYDDEQDGCHDFFHKNGFGNIQDAWPRAKGLPGANLCSSVEETRTKSCEAEERVQASAAASTASGSDGERVECGKWCWRMMGMLAGGPGVFAVLG